MAKVDKQKIPAKLPAPRNPTVVPMHKKKAGKHRDKKKETKDRDVVDFFKF